MNRWATGKFTPSVDPTQNIKDVQGSYTNGMATISFTRKRNTGDSTFDVMFNDTYCPYFLFAYGGDVSKTTSGDYSVTYHQARYSSMERICVKACRMYLFRITLLETFILCYSLSAFTFYRCEFKSKFEV